MSCLAYLLVLLALKIPSIAGNNCTRLENEISLISSALTSKNELDLVVYENDTFTVECRSKCGLNHFKITYIYTDKDSGNIMVAELDTSDSRSGLKQEDEKQWKDALIWYKINNNGHLKCDQDHPASAKSELNVTVRNNTGGIYLISCLNRGTFEGFSRFISVYSKMVGVQVNERYPSSSSTTQISIAEDAVSASFSSSSITMSSVVPSSTLSMPVDSSSTLCNCKDAVDSSAVIYSTSTDQSLLPTPYSSRLLSDIDTVFRTHTTQMASLGRISAASVDASPLLPTATSGIIDILKENKLVLSSVFIGAIMLLIVLISVSTMLIACRKLRKLQEEIKRFDRVHHEGQARPSAVNKMVVFENEKAAAQE